MSWDVFLVILVLTGPHPPDNYVARDFKEDIWDEVDLEKQKISTDDQRR